MFMFENKKLVQCCNSLFWFTSTVYDIGTFELLFIDNYFKLLLVNTVFYINIPHFKFEMKTSL